VIILYNLFCNTCGLVVRVLDYRSRGPRFDSRALQKKSSGSGTGSIQPRESTTEELLDRKVAAPV
jgi:predicted DCC family thiol-disulfide oxidoreductase YuxK